MNNDRYGNINTVKTEGFKYLVCGVLTTIVNIASYFILNKFQVYYLVNNTISFVLSVVFAFISNKIYVFESKSFDRNILIAEIWKFSISRLGTFGIDSILMVLLIDYIEIDEMFSKVFVNVIVIVCNYFISKHYVFKSKRM